MRYICENCSTEYDLTKEHYGKELQCTCGQTFKVPDLEEKMPMVPIEVIIIGVVTVLIFLAGISLIVLNIGLVRSVNGLVDIALGLTGAFLLVVGSLISCFGLAVRKLHSIEWYLSRMYKDK